MTQEQPTDYYDIPSVPQTRRPLGQDMDDTVGDRFFDLQPNGSSPTPRLNRQLPPGYSNAASSPEEKENIEVVSAKHRPHRVMPPPVSIGKNLSAARLPQRQSGLTATNALPQRRSESINAKTKPTQNETTRRTVAEQRRSRIDTLPKSSLNNSTPSEARLPQRRSGLTATNALPQRRSGSVDAKTKSTQNETTRRTVAEQRRSRIDTLHKPSPNKSTQSEARLPQRRSGAISASPNPTQNKTERPAAMTKSKDLLPKPVPSNVAKSGSRLPPRRTAAAATNALAQRRSESVNTSAKPVQGGEIRTTLMELRPRKNLLPKPLPSKATLSKARIQPQRLTDETFIVPRRSALETYEKRIKPGNGKPATVFSDVLRKYRTPTCKTPFKPSTVPYTPHFHKTNGHHCKPTGTQDAVQANAQDVNTTRPQSSASYHPPPASRNLPSDFWDRLSKPKHVTAKVTATPQVAPKQVFNKIGRIGVSGVPAPSKLPRDPKKA